MLLIKGFSGFFIVMPLICHSNRLILNEKTHSKVNELGDFYRLQQNFDKSIEYLKKSLDYDPQKYPEINFCKRMHTLASLYKQRESIEEQKKGSVEI
jgi:hypothetical protein